MHWSIYESLRDYSRAALKLNDSSCLVLLGCSKHKVKVHWAFNASPRRNKPHGTPGDKALIEQTERRTNLGAINRHRDHCECHSPSELYSTWMRFKDPRETENLCKQSELYSSPILQSVLCPCLKTEVSSFNMSLRYIFFILLDFLGPHFAIK